MTSTAAPPAFDYEAKQWGAAALRAKPWYMNGLKRHFLLEDLREVRGRVLDVGCGAGQVAKAVKLERPDLEVVGCDMSHSAIAAASGAAQGVEFRLATAERLPFDDGEFDFVWIFDVLEHVEEPERVLHEVARVLRPGGGFHIVLPLEGQPHTFVSPSRMRNEMDGQSASRRPHPDLLGLPFRGYGRRMRLACDP